MYTNLTENEYLSKSDDERYEIVRRATIDDMCGEEHFNKFYQNTGKRWLDLVRVWNRAHGHLKYFALVCAVHKIFWGVYPNGQTYNRGTLGCLLHLIEMEILSDGEAFRQWKNWSAFKRAVEWILNASMSIGGCVETYALEHRRYLHDRASCKILYDKDPKSCQNEQRGNYQWYEKTVQRLIPNAAHWNREQWGNEMTITAAIKGAYGVDYSKNMEEYDFLIGMLRREHQEGFYKHFLWYAMSISTLPEPLAKTIWGESWREKAVGIFLDAYREVGACEDTEERGEVIELLELDLYAVGDFERYVLYESWLFLVIKEMVDSGELSGEQYRDVQSAYFDILITCG